MKDQIDLTDIQGNITRAYGRYRFPKARYFFLHIREEKYGRKFINQIIKKVTTAAYWKEGEKPLVTLNIGFTFRGLLKLSLPIQTLQSLPYEFIYGMKSRATMLGDNLNCNTNDDEFLSHWDPIWKNNRCDEGNDNDVHIWISMNAQVKDGTDKEVEELEEQTDWLRNICDDLDQNVRILTTNGKNGDQEYQSASTVFHTCEDGSKWPTSKEHFGFTDGIGNPVFKGQLPDEEMQSRVIGNGKWMSKSKGWEPLATGEFILGYPDESQELPPTTRPYTFTKNGSFMVYRKLHQNITSFKDVINEEAKIYSNLMDVDIDEASVTLKSKMVGRWPDGIPLFHCSNI